MGNFLCVCYRHHIPTLLYVQYFYHKDATLFFILFSHLTTHFANTFLDAVQMANACQCMNDTNNVT